MKRSALASRPTLVQNLTVRAALAVAVAGFLSAMASPAAAASSAAVTSDNFRINPEDVKANETPLGISDPDFRALHGNWGKINGPVAPKIDVAIPSIDPVESMRLSSGFGPRRAPIRGASRNHKGIDIPGPVGTPIFATADAIVMKSEWVRGYGKYVELSHGNEIETRYGHLSSFIVEPGQRVKKGDVIGYMGSTGNSTGSHLHYEIRVSGAAVNPMSFLSAPVQSNSLIAAHDADSQSVGGPAE